MVEMPDMQVQSFVDRYKAGGLSGRPSPLEEVVALEHNLGVAFPASYKALLLVMGRYPDDTFVGSHCTVGHLPKLRGWADELLQECGQPFRLPEDAYVFLMHQGYSFLYFLLCDGSDPPVFCFSESYSGPVQVASSLSELVLRQITPNRAI